MGFKEKVQESFKKAKEDAEGIKNELAFMVKRVAKIEEVLNKLAINGQLDSKKKKKL
jgi:uncharacterized protein YwgA